MSWNRLFLWRRLFPCTFLAKVVSIYKKNDQKDKTIDPLVFNPTFQKVYERYMQEQIGQCFNDL